ncbi:YdeI/OmpD-associated family protein [Jiulongibacter sp. NS-SX5]|uniref:YdeI/OmpD-associated family protein n=1 Tax=Jiulongibacter sp. NS-SX5 TaxID=3463854 RepID=UPI004059A599
MVELELEMLKYGQMGEKTGWTYLEIEQAVAHQLKPDTKTSFRVRGQIDSVKINQLALIPVGEGNFILPLKADLRRKLKKEKGYKVTVKLELDNSEFEFDEDFMACLEDEQAAKEFFESLTPGHRRYFSKWIASAKTIDTKTKRISQALYGLSNKMEYNIMIRHFKAKK